MTDTLINQLESLQRRDSQRAALLRRYGFSDLAAVYSEGSDTAQTRLRSLTRSAGVNRAEGPRAARDPWTGASLPQRNRMRALTRLVRTDMSANRAWSRTLGRIAEQRTGLIADAATAAATRVSEQTDELNERLRARLSRWASRGDA